MLTTIRTKQVESSRPTDAAPEYGRTVADAMRVMRRVRRVLVSVRVGQHDHAWMDMPVECLLSEIGRSSPDELFATCFNPRTGTLTVGGLDAIVRAELPHG